MDFPYGRASIKPAKSYFSVAVPQLQETVAVAGLLKYDAYLRAQDGDLGTALDDVRAIIHASRAIGDEPYMVSQLVSHEYRWQGCCGYCSVSLGWG